tara:strand:+ start:744 stop:1157 length:414 start_codon:yes stop_codon:yes gene_type:complete
MISFSYNIIMARFYDTTYDPRQDSGTSGADISDINPEQAYDVDLRRLEMDERGDVAGSNKQQKRISRFFKASRAAGKYRQERGFAEPSVGGRTPIGKADLEGTELPSLRGRNFGGPGAGSTKYAGKPQPQFGKPFYM